MVQIFDVLIILVVALNFVALGVSRIRGVINAVALQGVLLGTFPLFVHSQIGRRVILLIVVTIVLKGRVIPVFLVQAMREANIRHQVKPVVSFVSSLLLGAVGTGLAMMFSHTLPLTKEHSDMLLVPASLSTVWTGFLMLTSRREAIMQVLGFLLLENGILLFGLLLLEAMPFLVEAGVLLDLFTGVFVMGIIIHHINREFDSISTEHLSKLKE
ncbi:MAG: hydrogenase [Planctomycetia bacterium]|nr:hydrogenase [Planctomycetia bacterium]